LKLRQQAGSRRSRAGEVRGGRPIEKGKVEESQEGKSLWRRNDKAIEKGRGIKEEGVMGPRKCTLQGE